MGEHCLEAVRVVPRSSPRPGAEPCAREPSCPPKPLTQVSLEGPLCGAIPFQSHSWTQRPEET